MTAEDSLALLLDIGFSRDDWTKFKSVTDEHLKPANMSLFPSNTHIQHAKYNIIDNKVVEEKMELTAEKKTLPIRDVSFSSGVAPPLKKKTNQTEREVVKVKFEFSRDHCLSTNS